MTIMAHVSRRVNKRTVRTGVRKAARELVAAAERYRDGTPAERDSHAILAARLKQEMRASYFAGVGRRIDLEALLGLTKNKKHEGERGEPVWAIVDPRQPIGPGNESAVVGQESWRTGSTWVRDSLGQYCCGLGVGGAVVPLTHDRERAGKLPHWNRKVAGIPAIPHRVRRLLDDPRLRHANMVGLLFQPDEWQMVRPDPAIVVEWRDRPGEYYALAVWGHDGPRIMEFVD